MKSNNSITGGGHLLTEYYEEWADTIAAFPAVVKENTGVDLYSMSPQKHRGGMYLFGGAGLNLVNAGIPGIDGGTTFSLGGGVGTRKRIGNAALRFEGGLRYDTEDSDAGMPSQFLVGGRVGLSFWH